MPNNLSYEIRNCECKEALTLVIIDSEEVWIPLSDSDETVLVTNSETIVAIAKMEFEFLWLISKKHSQSESVKKQKREKVAVDNKNVHKSK